MKHSGIFVLLVIGLVLITSCQSSSLIDNSRVVVVQGKGAVGATADVASFTITVSVLEETTKEALNKTSKTMSELLAIAKDAGVQQRDLRTSVLQINPEYRYVDNEQVLSGQRVRQSVVVLIRAIEADGKALSSLIDRMALISGISIGSIVFDKEHTEQLYEQSRLLAMEDALQKARDYAQAVGLSVGKPLKIESSFDASPRQLSSMASFASEMPVQEIEISSSVNVVFELR
ncbi:MAG: SIMPL domain-containing protein [Sphaerochaetaceae bacterium]|jgi:uncharacterized protein YggE